MRLCCFVMIKTKLKIYCLICEIFLHNLARDITIVYFLVTYAYRVMRVSDISNFVSPLDERMTLSLISYI